MQLSSPVDACSARHWQFPQWKEKATTRPEQWIHVPPAVQTQRRCKPLPSLQLTNKAAISRTFSSQKDKKGTRIGLSAIEQDAEDKKTDFQNPSWIGGKKNCDLLLTVRASTTGNWPPGSAAPFSVGSGSEEIGLTHSIHWLLFHWLWVETLSTLLRAISGCLTSWLDLLFLPWWMAGQWTGPVTPLSGICCCFSLPKKA